MNSKVTRTLALLMAALLFVAGCSSSDDAGAVGAGDENPSEPSGESTPDAGGAGSDDSPPDDAAPVGDQGSITINGDVYAVSTLNRCIPTGGDDLDLQALANGVKINLYARNGELSDVSVDGRVVEEEYGSRAFGRDPVITESSVDGDRTTGSATLGDSTGSDATVEVEWDVQIPADERDCSL